MTSPAVGRRAVLPVTGQRVQDPCVRLESSSRDPTRSRPVSRARAQPVASTGVGDECHDRTLAPRQRPVVRESIVYRTARIFAAFDSALLLGYSGLRLP